MSSSIIFLTGAPDSRTLDWTENELFSDLLPSFDNNHTPKQRSSEARTAWRVLHLQRQHLPTGLTQDTPLKRIWQPQKDTDASFFTCSNVSLTSPEEEVHSTLKSTTSSNDEELLSQFYEHSLGIHEDTITSSQLEPEQTQSHDESTFLSEDNRTDSFNNDTTLESINPSSFSSPPRLTSTRGMGIGHITDIRQIPKASYLESIIPQTMTVNLIVGVIHISPARRVMTRRAGRVMEIIEMLVGDETRAGFGISFWFYPEQAQAPKTAEGVRVSTRPIENNLRAALTSLRPRDVILARNVALSSFRGRVFGQSLRREVTKLYLLYRSPGDTPERATDDDDDETHLKMQRVRDWVVEFVGPPTIRRDGSVVHGRETLPPDTQ